VSLRDVRPHGGHRVALGLGLTLALSGSFLLTMSDTLAKLAMARAPLSQFIVLSGLVVLPLLLMVATATRRLAVLRIRNRPALMLRCAATLSSTLLFFAGLHRLPLGDTYAIAFTAPIIALPLAAWLLKERVGWRRWSAVLVGFFGVLLAMLPTGQGYAWTAALFPLGAAACGALRDISSRRLSATDASLGILFYSVLTVTVGGAALGLIEGGWVPIELGLVALIAGCAVVQNGAALLQIEAFRYVEVSFLAPYRYVALVFAAAMGFLVWGDVPAWNVAVGGLIIVGSGIFIWYRERVAKRR
jgi:drug/metabolite transporter (DMT)-like permease